MQKKDLLKLIKTWQAAKKHGDEVANQFIGKKLSKQQRADIEVEYTTIIIKEILPAEEALMQVE